MNKMERSPAPDAETKRPDTPDTKVAVRHGKGRLLAAGALLLLGGALAVSVWRHYNAHAQVMAAAEQRRDFVPTVTTATVNASGKTMSVTWPGTTEAFAQANIYARASGYISKREVDIGSRVKAGQLLLEIRLKPRAISVRSPGTATALLCKRVGLPSNRAIPIA